MHQLQERFSDISIEDRSTTFNTERVAALEFAFMLDVAEAIVSAGVASEKSRAARTSAPIFLPGTIRVSSHIR